MRSLRVLVGCEFSGVVRRAFASRGHDAWSCDLLPAEDGSNRHLQCDVRDILGEGWDLLAVMHPPCTRLCNSGVRWLFKPPAGRRAIRAFHRAWKQSMQSPLKNCKIYQNIRWWIHNWCKH